MNYLTGTGNLVQVRYIVKRKWFLRFYRYILHTYMYSQKFDFHYMYFLIGISVMHRFNSIVVGKRVVSQFYQPCWSWWTFETKST